MSKKGQAAMEFLMTYGWAILVVIAAIGALAYFDVFSADNLLPETTTFAAPLPNLDTAVATENADGNIELEVAFRNNVGETINLTGNGGSNADSCEAIETVDAHGSDVEDGLVSSGDQFLITWECDGVADRINGEFSFEYVNMRTEQTRSHVGDVSVRP